MILDLALTSLLVMLMAAGLIYHFVSDAVGRRRTERMNALLQARYQSRLAAALRDGTKPPFPPNRLVWE